ncbi:Hypothetical protein D9617_27g045420 [Elsinoe fawcettii]|nr:Hypothetical protein D9617_27g045420 [Elsinoe fawcettii]
MDITEQQALHATYAAGAISAAILIARLVLSFRAMDISFYITLVALPVVLARTFIRHFSLSYGTASDAIKELKVNPAYQPDYHKIRIAAGLSISGRIVLTTHLWLMCLLLLLTYRRFVRHLPWMQHALHAIYATMAITWIATTSLNLFECHPFSKYAQVIPDPGICLKAYKQTLMQTVSNIVLDIAIMAISIPILLIQTGNAMLKLRLAGLISLGSVCIIASALRAAYIYKTGSSQPARDLWAAVTVVCSTVVANAPFLYGAVGRRRAEKSSYQYYGGATGPTGRTGLGTMKNTTVKEAELADVGDLGGIQKEMTTLVVSEEIDTGKKGREGDEIELLRR